MKEEELKKGLKLNRLKLNHPCKICSGIIFIGNCTLTKEGSFHTDCLLKREFKAGQLDSTERCLKDEIEFLEKLIREDDISGITLRWIFERRNKLKQELTQKVKDDLK